jgi:hypothetical protein
MKRERIDLRFRSEFGWIFVMCCAFFALLIGSALAVEIQNPADTLFVMYGTPKVFTQTEINNGDLWYYSEWQIIYAASRTNSVEGSIDVSLYGTLFIQTTDYYAPGMYPSHRYDWLRLATGDQTMGIELQYSSNVEGGWSSFPSAVNAANDGLQAAAASLMFKTNDAAMLRLRILAYDDSHGIKPFVTIKKSPAMPWIPQLLLNN